LTARTKILPTWTASRQLLDQFHDNFNSNELSPINIILKAKNKSILSAHDVSDGGVFMNLLESAMVNNLGFEINSDSAIRKDAFLFGEAQSRVIVTVSANNTSAIETDLKNQTIAFTKLGTVKGHSIVVDSTNYGLVSEYKQAFDTSIEGYMN